MEENKVIITWAESQMYAEVKGFYDNAELINSNEGIKEFGSCAFVVNRDFYERAKDILQNHKESEMIDEEDNEIPIAFKETYEYPLNYEVVA